MKSNYVIVSIKWCIEMEIMSTLFCVILVAASVIHGGSPYHEWFKIV